MNTQLKQRKMREYQAKHRGSRTSYRTQIEDLQILLAWEAAELSEGQVCKALELGRIEARTMRIIAIRAGCKLVDALRPPPKQEASNAEG